MLLRFPCFVVVRTVGRPAEGAQVFVVLPHLHIAGTSLYYMHLVLELAFSCQEEMVWSPAGDKMILGLNLKERYASGFCSSFVLAFIYSRYFCNLLHSPE